MTVAPVRASLAQHGMWLTERLGLAATAYHMPLPVWLDGPLDAPALVVACADVVDRHPVLASVCEELDGELWLRPGTGSGVMVTATADPQELIRAETVRPFDLAGGPLARFTLAALGPDRHLLLIVAHHLVFDGQSKEILLRDLAEAYARRRDSTVDVMPGITVGHRTGPAPEAVAAALPAARAHWAAYPHTSGTPALPGLRGLPASAGTGEVADLTVDAVALRATATALGATVFEVLLSGLLTLQHRYADQRPAVAVDFGTRSGADHDTVGLFVNELPVAVDVTGERTGRGVVALVRERLRSTYPVRAVPLSHAVPGLAPRAALAGVSMSYRRRTAADPVFAGVAARVDWTAYHHSARNALHVQVLDDGGPDLTLRLHRHTEALAEADADRIAGHYRAVLAGIAADPDRPVGELELLGEEERDRLLTGWNDTARPVAGPGTLPELVAAWISATPAATAVTGEAGSLTYAELDRTAAAVASRLAGLGVGAGDVVGVCAARTPALVAALLGVVRTGAAYLPMDPGYPAARLAYLAEDARPAAVVADPASRAVAAAVGVPVVEVGGAADGPAPGRGPGPGDLAYLIYTSGSTGRPKGVEVEHGAVANLLAAMRETVGAAEGDAWLAVASAAFDMSVPELWLPLATGGTVVLATEAQTRDAEALLRLIRTAGVTHAHLTPSTWQRLLDAGYDEPGVVAISGAEALPLPLAREIRRRSARLWNLYGPTETTVWSTAAELAEPLDEVTIGRPLANTTAYVLDAAGRPVPEGVVGELYLGGAGVARGYHGRPELTAERFTATPWGRLYRTGDRVRYRSGGRLEYLGRADDQVKLRGYRIELGEIEARLAAYPSVVRAAVALDGDELAAYLVGSALVAAELRAYLAAELPPYLIPASFRQVAALPLNTNGKLDRDALSTLDFVELVSTSEPYAYTGLARDVYEIWREVLGHGEIGPDDDLFDLGGHSLTVTKIAARLRQRLGVDLPLHVFFDTPTISGLVTAATEL